MDLFKTTRFKLTFWYVVIVFVLLFTSSLAAINAETRAFNRIQEALSDRIQRPKLTALLETRLNEFESQFVRRLIFLDLFLFVIGAIGAYYLSGITLRPIEEMISAQEQFARDASHQLRTPLTIIRMEIEALNRTQKQIPKVFSKVLSSITGEVSRMSEIVESLLTQVRQPFKNPRPQTVSFTEIVKTSVSKMQAVAGQKQIKLSSSLTPNIQVNGETHKLEELVRILIDNALKYTSDRGEVAVKLIKLEGKANLTVTDTGIGISKTDLPHIFDRFYRATQTQHLPGTGLGLAIAKQIVEKHSGQITVASSLQKGSEFKVSFPLA